MNSEKPYVKLTVALTQEGYTVREESDDSIIFSLGDINLYAEKNFILANTQCVQEEKEKYIELCKEKIQEYIETFINNFKQPFVKINRLIVSNKEVKVVSYENQKPLESPYETFGTSIIFDKSELESFSFYGESEDENLLREESIRQIEKIKKNIDDYLTDIINTIKNQ